MRHSIASEIETIVAAVRKAVGHPGQSVLVHGPAFDGNEWQYAKECVDTAWVSTAGAYVTRFEKQIAEFTGAAYAIAVVNGTSALHVALELAGVHPGDEVLVPALSFVATANAVTYCGAIPHFCDVDPLRLGLDAERIGQYLRNVAQLRPKGCFNRHTGRRISAIIPMHALGHPVDMDALAQVAAEYQLIVVEDAAESLGSFYKGRHTGTLGRLGILSFNSNKIVTTGGGGAILTDDPALGDRAKHVTSTAKLPHTWEYIHDEIGYNYRMPNINAALGCAQMERLSNHLDRKRKLAQRYFAAFEGLPQVQLVAEPHACQSNYWLNTLLLDRADAVMRDELLFALNQAGLQSRPIWRPMHQLQMYAECPRMDLGVTEDMALRVISMPSSPLLVNDLP